MAGLIHLCNVCLESLWLLAIVLVPMAFIDQSSFHGEAIISYIEVPKIALLRTLTGLMLVVLVIQWWLGGMLAGSDKSNVGLRILRTSAVRTGFRNHPTRWVVLAILVFLGSTIISTCFSGALEVSLWGEVPGQDGYALYTVVSYLIILTVLVFRLRTKNQFWRLMYCLVFVGVVVSGYGICQRYQKDFLDLNEITGGGTARVTSFMGNTLFTAAVLLMTFILTLALATVLLPKSRLPFTKTNVDWRYAARLVSAYMIWSSALAIQILGLIFTYSRGPWLGTMFGLAVFLVLTTGFLRWRGLSKPCVLLCLSSVFIGGALYFIGDLTFISLVPWISLPLGVIGVIGVVVVLNNWSTRKQIYIGSVFLAAIICIVVAIFGIDRFKPSTDDGFASDQIDSLGVIERFSTIKKSITSGDLGNRYEHWETAWQLIKYRPWPDFDTLNFKWLRPFIGYGPDLFRYVYLLESPEHDEELYVLEPDHAHNFFIHQTVEQGFLGLLSLVSIAAALVSSSIYLLWKSGDHLTDRHKLLMFGLLAILCGRCLEMMVGVARVSDLMLLWVIIAIFIVLPRINLNQNDSGGMSVNSVVAESKQHNFFQIISIDYTWMIIVRSTVLIGVLAGISYLIWFANINYVRAGMVAGQAIRHSDVGDLQNTVRLLDKATQLAPDVSFYHHQKALFYKAFHTGKSGLKDLNCQVQRDVPYDICIAIENIKNNQKAFVQRPLYYKSPAALGQSAYEYQDYEAAATYLSLTSQMVPNSWPVLEMLGDSYYQLGKFQQAIITLDQHLEITDGNKKAGGALFVMGNVHRKLGNDMIAADYYERAASADLSMDKTGIALNELGEIYRSYDAVKGVQAFDRIIERQKRARDDPRFTVGHKGKYLRDIGEYYEALRIFHSLLSDHDGEHEAGYPPHYDSRGIPILGWRAEIYKELGFFAMAISDYIEILNLDPGDRKIWVLLSELQMAMGNSLGAEEAVAMARKLGAGRK